MESLQSGNSLRKSSNSPYDEQNIQQKHQIKRSELGNGAGAGNNGTAIWLATSDHSKSKYHDQNRESGDNDARDIAEPPLEYCENPRKQVCEVNGEYKRGILGSIFDKVRSKEDGGRKSVDCLPFGKDEGRRSQQLLDNLLLDCAGVRTSRESDKKTSQESDSIVSKPYEPPALGKSSRITPVGGLEEPFVPTSQTVHSTSLNPLPTGLEPDAVEVLSVIR